MPNATPQFPVAVVEPAPPTSGSPDAVAPQVPPVAVQAAVTANVVVPVAPGAMSEAALDHSVAEARGRVERHGVEHGRRALVRDRRTDRRRGAPAIDAGVMPTLKLSHASPWPSPSLSAWPVLATVGQLSTGSSTVSPSVSTISTWTWASM